MKTFLGAAFLCFMAAAFFFSVGVQRKVVVVGQKESVTQKKQGVFDTAWERIFHKSSSSGETNLQTLTTSTFESTPYQKPLAAPPTVVKALYLTGWSAGSKKKIEEIKRVVSSTEINALVIDVKDYSGYLSYETNIPLAEEIGAHNEQRIKEPNKLIKELHDEGIYLIARVSVFQDPILAAGRPAWALSRADGSLWKDRKGLAWMDTASEEVWKYNVAIAKDALARGFDEINFDYIRFPSDGDLKAAIYPAWKKETPRHEVLRSFFSYLRKELPQAKISADVFGLVTVNPDDMGIGQILEDAYEYFDYVAPMVYPSHYAAGFIGYANPAAHPGEVVKYSLDEAVKRLARKTASSTASSTLTETLWYSAKLRPWLQDFDLGADYDDKMVRAQIEAVSRALEKRPEAMGGWMLWDPGNHYTLGALHQ